MKTPAQLSPRAVRFFTFVGRLWPEFSLLAVWVNVGLFPALWVVLAKHWAATGVAHMVLVVAAHQDKPL